MTTQKTPEEIARTTLERIASIHAERLTGQNALSLMVAAIEADRAQPKTALVVLVDGEVVEGPNVDVLDIGFTSYRFQHEYEQEDIDGMLASLRDGGFDSQAERLQRWWDDR